MNSYDEEDMGKLDPKMQEPKKRSFKKRDQAKAVIEFSNKVNDVVVSKELVEKWKGCTKGLPNLHRTAEITDGRCHTEEEIHPKGCNCSYCDKAPEVETQTKEVGYQGYWDRPIPPMKGPETYTLKKRTEEEELAELARIQEEDANSAELGHPQLAEGADQANDKWDDFLKSCMEGYVSSIGNRRHNGYYEENTKLKGILIFYINVGQLSLGDAESMIDRMKDKLSKMTERLPEDWESVWMPVRQGDTRIEKVTFNG